MHEIGSISVVLPTYREQLSIRDTINGFYATGIVDEVIVVKNNAERGTREALAGSGARPASQTRLIKSMAEYSEHSLAFLPLRAAMFFIHYWSISGIFLFLLFCGAAALVFLATRSISHSLWFTIIPLWASMLMMNMSREYQLFYDAGAGGFKEAVTYLRAHLQPDERFLGYRDLVVYTRHQAFCLYDYADGGRKLDTTRIDSLSRTRGLRYCAFLNDEIYKNDTIFHRSLTHRFDTVFVHRDYQVWKRR